ncbi:MULTISPECIES: hydroxymyristoyl-ACP dehydratase [unclassified Variovorax]|uniref:hydroxymyristoyl-ACP dehydratase n=1 Tax=unclassified Variovorax TaxID=663243 RepID=UPI000F7E3251|nr:MULTISPECIES: hydroxymyristoyl-ACP dehydratase [unclassified Variovorax]RSZ30415.1 hydroxymyristoyl-ACP dehydratase [Variovorax sp. 553]RSZ30952.1 hydroxymyristoyl-ACP dehydratase [Variovorax sp. 679]
MTAPQTLDRAGIARRIPHSGSMCLLERLEGWDADTIRCSTTTHAQSDNPLRTESGLLASNAIEYAAQAMALHGGLLAEEGSTPSAGFLASARNVKLAVARLDDVAGALQVGARRLSGDDRQILYEFTVKADDGRMLAEGRAVVVLNTPLAATAAESTATP